MCVRKSERSHILHAILRYTRLLFFNFFCFNALQQGRSSYCTFFFFTPTLLHAASDASPPLPTVLDYTLEGLLSYLLYSYFTPTLLYFTPTVLQTGRAAAAKDILLLLCCTLLLLYSYCTAGGEGRSGKRHLERRGCKR